MNRFGVWGAVCLLVGLAFLANALTVYRRRRRFLETAVPATGTVLSVRVEGIGRNAISIPTLEFQTADGAVHRAESLMGSGMQAFRAGQAVAVRYDPRDPTRAEVDTFWVLWGLAVLRAAFATVFIIMGVVGLVVSA